MKTLSQRFIDLDLLIPDESPTEVYTWQKTQASRLDVRRAINQQPCWLSQTNSKSTKQKKIILNFYQLSFGLSTVDVELVRFLLKKNFMIYIRTESGVLEEIKSSTDLAAKLSAVDIVPKDALEDELTIDNKEMSDFVVIDHIKRAHVLNELISYLGDYSFLDNAYELALTPETCKALDEKQIKSLCLIASQGLFTTISCPMDSGDTQYQFVWTNSFSPSEFERLLRSLKKGSVDEVFSSQNNSRLQELAIINSEAGVVIVLTQFSALKKLTIRTTERPQNIVGIDNLTELEELYLNFNFNDPKHPDIIINVAKLEKLKKLFVSKRRCDCKEKCSCLDIKGLENCVELNELTLENEVIKLNGQLKILDGSQLTELRTLTLNAYPGIFNNFDKLTKLESLTLVDLVFQSTWFISQINQNLRKLMLNNVMGGECVLEGPLLCTQLEELRINGGDIPSLDVSSLSQLRLLHLMNCNQLSTLKGVEKLGELEDLLLKKTGIRSVNVSALGKLLSLAVSGADILGLEACKLLTQLYLTQTNLGVLDLANHGNLVSLTLEDCPVIELIQNLQESRLEFLTLINCLKLILSQDSISSTMHLVNVRKIGGGGVPVPQEQVVDYSSFQHPEPSACSSGSSSVSAIETPSDISSQSAPDAPHFASELPICFKPVKKIFRNTSLYQTYVSPDTRLELEREIFPLHEEQASPDIRQIRYITLDRVALTEEKEPILKRVNPDLSYYQFKEYSDLERNNLYMGLIQTSPNIAGSYYLPGVTPKDKLIDLTDKASWNVYHSRATGQYLIHWRGKLEDMPLSPHYILYTGSQYFCQTAALPADFYPEYSYSRYLLPDEIEDAITYCLKVFPTPFFRQLKASSSKEEKLQLIADFCRSFKNEPLSLPENAEQDKDFIGAFKLILREGKGTDYHRSLVFMTLCQYYNIPAQVVQSRGYYYAQVKTTRGFRAFDLGGPDITIIEKPSPYLDKQFLAKVRSETQNREEMVHIEEEILNTEPDLGRPATEKKPARRDNFPARRDNSTVDWSHYFHKVVSNDVEMTKYHWRKQFTKANAWLQDCSHIDSFVSKLIDQNQPMLLRVPQKEEAWRWHALIREKAGSTLVVYIDFAYELSSLFEQIQIKDSQQISVDGPLKQMIERGHGIIVINWSNFTPRERGIFKCMMDEPPTLHGKLLPPGIKIVGTLGEHIEVNDIFLSRCNEIHFPKHLRRPTNGLYATRAWFKEPSQKDEESEVVNLYHSAEWSKFLVEDLSLHGDKYGIKPGSLVRAITEGHALVVDNPPMHDPSFQQFLHRFTTENTILYNGEYLPIHPNFTFTLRKKAPALTIPLAVVFDNGPTSGKKYHLNTENYYQLFELQQIGKDKRIYTLDGWLASYREGDQFIVEDKLSEDQWQRLFDTIAAMPEITRPSFHFYVEPKVDPRVDKKNLNVEKAAENCLPVVPSSVEQLVESNYPLEKSTRIESCDPAFLARVMAQKLAVPPEHLFHVSNEDCWSALIEQVNLLQNFNSIGAERHDGDFWRQLKGGETVILYGKMSAQDYMALKTLFTDHPYLYVNGERKAVKGKVVWIGEPNPDLANNYRPDYVFHPDLVNYREAYFASSSNEPSQALQNLEHFFAIIQRELPSFQLNYDKYQACVNALTLEQEKENPLKSVLHYHYKQDKKYEFLNVTAKILLSTTQQQSVRIDKLQSLLKQVHSGKDLRRLFWQIANCFSGHALKLSFKDLDMQITPSDDLQEALLFLLKTNNLVKEDWISDAFCRVENKEPLTTLTLKFPHPARLAKQMASLSEAMQQKDKRIIYLAGESVTGKTEAAHRIAKQYGKLFYGEDNILDWLKASHSSVVGTLTLILDDVNLIKTGKLEFLRGILQGVVHFKGTTYPLSLKHKVIVMGAHEQQFHPLLWNAAHVIWFKPFQPHFIRELVKCYLRDSFDEVHAISDAMMLAYNYLLNNPQCAPSVTLRELGNSCCRLKSMDIALPWQNIVGKALFDEMAGLLISKAARNQFKTFLQSQIGSWAELTPSKVPSDRELVIPPEKQEVWRLIENTLQLREERINRNSNLPGKLGTLLEGPSSVGKSTCWRKAAEQKGLSRDAKNSQLRYYQLTASDSDKDMELLLEAFEGGSTVILDELNLSPRIRTLLTQLLTGKNPAGEEAALPGFTVLASQNPPKNAGCALLSQKIASLFHKIVVDEHQLCELEYIAKTSGHPEPGYLVQAYKDVRQLHPEMRLNARNFFKVMRQTIPNAEHVYEKMQCPD
ncbi:MAG: hypothetical protein Q8M03_13715 [Legionella sp.]|nr:hypothetical protein [Legionella sp.]